MVIEKCLTCGSVQLKNYTYEDYDDLLDVDVPREGILCIECNCFHYEEDDRIILVFEIEN